MTQDEKDTPLPPPVDPAAPAPESDAGSAETAPAAEAQIPAPDDAAAPASADETVSAPDASDATAAATLPPDLPQRIEAVLMATDRAIPPAKLSELLGKVGVKAVQNAIKQLNETYAQTNRSFRIEQLANGWQILTLPQYAQVVSALHRARESAKLTPAGLETLAIIAYKQPITRADVEAIRGVASGEVIRTLMERHLVKIVGRAEELGRPMLYGTTKTFLEVFGLASVKDLPKIEELKPKA